MTCKITVQGNNGKKEERQFPSLVAASAAFKAAYAEYPEVIVIAGIPRYHFREGPNGTIFLSDERGDIEMSSDGEFYIGASLGPSEYVQGYGYMRLDPIWGKIWEKIPESAIEGAYTGRNDLADPVRIDNLVVEQAELSRVTQETGKLPTHVYHMDYSGSIMYIQGIEWGDVPHILGL